MGRAHAGALAADERVELVAVCDADEERGREAAAELGVETCMADYRAIVDDPTIDIATVATPDDFHCAMTCELLASGKHVLCEKPMAPSLDECAQMVRAAREAGRELMIGQSYRFDPKFRVIYDLVRAGEVGEVYYAESDYWNNLEGVGGIGNWRNDPAIRHPYIGGCHAMDLIRWIVDQPVVEVMAYANHKAFVEQPTDDFVMGNVKFAGGALGRAIVSSGCKCPFVTTLNVYGTAGSIENWRISHGKSEAFEPLAIPEGRPSSIVAEQAAFVDAVLDADEPAVSAEDGYGTMAACFAVVESTQTGTPVKVEQAV